MNPNIFKELTATREKMEQLEKTIARQNRKLAALPGKFGFKSVAEFVAAVNQACGLKGAGPGARARRGAGGKSRRSRAVITEATRAEVKKLVDAGKTGAEISAAVGISLPSVHNIKKALGLVKKR